MKVLLVKTSSLGDVIHNLPVVSDILRYRPEARIDWVVEDSFAEIPRLHPGVRQVIPVAVRRWRKALFAADTWRDLRQYRRLASAEFYDAILDTQGLLKSALLATCARGEKFGFAAAVAREPLAARFYDRRIEIPRRENAVLRNRRLAAAALGYTLDTLALDYGISASPDREEWLPMGDYAVLLTATSRADKEWDEANWLALGAMLNTAGLLCVLPGGGPDERTRAARLAGGIERACAAPAMNLVRLARLLAGARIVIGVDTGLVHLAAALARPTLALYRASDPGLTGVLGTAPHRNLGAAGHPPAVHEVGDAALALLAE